MSLVYREFIERKVSGVFFAPLELAPRKDETNLAIVQVAGESSNSNRAA
jgi:hypothetical protein